MLINGCNINYVNYGNKKGKAIVLLHGWGQNIAMMDMIGKAFSEDFNILILDLPGYGESEEPKTAWYLIDYVNMLHEFLEKLKVEKPIIIGHSFGGRMGILYSSMYEVTKLVLLSAPYKKGKTNSLKVKFLKFCKKIPVVNKLEDFAKKHIGSDDYRNASTVMRNILVNTVNEDLTEAASKITCPTLLIYGTEDKTPIPISDAEELTQIIADCGLVVYEGASHFAYLERINQTVSVLNNFFEKERK